jgi:cyclophilin family peptidyl-prolyl cis-trans isomerase
MATLRLYLEDTYGENIRVAYRHLPLISIHDKAVITAEGAEAAGAQGKFFEMHDLLFERQQEWFPLTEEQMQTKLVEYAEELGLDTDRFAQELSDHVYRDKIIADYEEYSQYGPSATPTYVVNNVFSPQLGILHPILVDVFVRLVTSPPEQYDEVPSEVIDPDKAYTATIRTNKGDIVVELLAEQAPTNVNSFVFLAQDGWYDDQAFFLVQPGSAAHSGDPTNAGIGLMSKVRLVPGVSFAYPGYYCGDEISPDLTFDDAGMLALYAPPPGHNSSQFFITNAPIPDLNGQLTIIGRVVEGMDVLESLTPTQPGPDQPSPDVIETILIEEQ